MEFGVWKYMYSNPQYKATGRQLLKAFPNKPKSTPALQYNNQFIFNELDAVNRMRNRIAHHEPVGIDSRSLLFGMDHVKSVCKEIEAIKL